MSAAVNVVEHLLVGFNEGVEWSHLPVNVAEVGECGFRHVLDDREDRRFLGGEIAGERSWLDVDGGGDLLDRRVHETMPATQLDAALTSWLRVRRRLRSRKPVGTSLASITLSRLTSDDESLSQKFTGWSKHVPKIGDVMHH